MNALLSPRTEMRFAVTILSRHGKIYNGTSSRSFLSSLAQFHHDYHDLYHHHRRYSSDSLSSISLLVRNSNIDSCEVQRIHHHHHRLFSAMPITNYGRKNKKGTKSLSKLDSKLQLLASNKLTKKLSISDEDLHRNFSSAALQEEEEEEELEIQQQQQQLPKVLLNYYKAKEISDSATNHSNRGNEKTEKTVRQQPRLEALRQKLKQEKENNFESFQQEPATLPSPTPFTLNNGQQQQKQKHEIDYTKVPKISANDLLTDRHGRFHSYLRISLTERCNLRCTYCMPEKGIPLLPPSNLLQNNEIMQLAKHFMASGVDKIRLTGGEPTLRRDLVDILHGITEFSKQIGGEGSGHGHQLKQLGITTNGITLSKNLKKYIDAGLTSVNISLDTLDPVKFTELTRRPHKYFDKVMEALECANKYAAESYHNKGSRRFTAKLNCVVMRDVNDEEIYDFIQLIANRFPNVSMRFIEFMPFTANEWNRNKFIPYKELLDQITKKNNESNGMFSLQPLPENKVDPNDTTKWWTYHNDTHTKKGKIGFITSMSDHFCAGCNRIRITADGEIKVCLFDGNSTLSLRDALRQNGGQHDIEDLNSLIMHALQQKHYKLGGNESPDEIALRSPGNRPMTTIGG